VVRAWPGRLSISLWDRNPGTPTPTPVSGTSSTIPVWWLEFCGRVREYDPVTAAQVDRLRTIGKTVATALAQIPGKFF